MTRLTVNRWPSFRDSKLHITVILAGILVLEVLLVGDLLPLQRFQSVSHLHNDRALVELSIGNVIEWLKETYLSLVNNLSANDRLLLGPLQTMQVICGMIRRGFVPTSRRGARGLTWDVKIMSREWKEFREGYPGASCIIACVINILSDFDAGLVHWDLDPLAWKDRECLQWYRQSEQIVNMVYQAFLADNSEPPVSRMIFPHWHIAYRNGHKDFALETWLQVRNMDDDIDLYGMSFAHLVVDRGDLEILNRMGERKEFIGRLPRSLLSQISPSLLAAAIDDVSIYISLRNHQVWLNMDAEIECLELAAMAGSTNMVTLLQPEFRHLPPFLKIRLIRFAINSNHENIAWLFLELMTQDQAWLDLDFRELARLAKEKGFTNLAERLEATCPSEPRAGDALDNVNDECPASNVLLCM